MIRFSKKRLDDLLEQFSGKKIAIVGDLMLDHYVWGNVSRISPEAPVPVVEVESETVRFGGAANVANNVLSLGTVACPVGIVGDDVHGRRIRTLFEERGVSTDGILTVPGRPTTVKTRIMAHNQHVVRTDWENKKTIDPEIEEQILSFLSHMIRTFDGIILEDYNKGLLTGPLIQQIINLAQEKKIFVDPKYNHFFDYRGVTLFKPNRKEAEDRLNMPMKSFEDRRVAGNRLMERLECESVMITLGEEGLILFERDGQCTEVPTKAVKVHDVSGAGDTVIATMAVAVTAGATFKEAATLANHAAGIVVGKVGIEPIHVGDLKQAMLDEIAQCVQS